MSVLIAQTCLTFSDLMVTKPVAHQAPLSIGFSRQEYWSGLPCPPPGALPDPEIKPVSLMSPGRHKCSLSLPPPEKPSGYSHIPWNRYYANQNMKR